MPTLKYRYGYGCRVVLATSDDRDVGVVLGVAVHGKGEPSYRVRWSDYTVGRYFESELESVTEERDEPA